MRAYVLFKHLILLIKYVQKDVREIDSPHQVIISECVVDGMSIDALVRIGRLGAAYLSESELLGPCLGYRNRDRITSPSHTW